jgi:hypothetical protein
MDEAKLLPPFQKNKKTVIERIAMPMLEMNSL